MPEVDLVGGLLAIDKYPNSSRALGDESSGESVAALQSGNVKFGNKT